MGKVKGEISAPQAGNSNRIFVCFLMGTIDQYTQDQSKTIVLRCWPSVSNISHTRRQIRWLNLPKPEGKIWRLELKV
jgi:hypothetical protein